MIFDLNQICSHFNLKIKGVLHIGAFIGEELKPRAVYIKAQEHPALYSSPRNTSPSIHILALIIQN